LASNFLVVTLATAYKALAILGIYLRLYVMCTDRAYSVQPCYAPDLSIGKAG